MAENDDFYVRYYTGHSGMHGHEFLEFEYSRGRLRYANNSNYRNDSLIRKESECSSGPLRRTRRKTSRAGSTALQPVQRPILGFGIQRSSPQTLMSTVWVSGLMIQELRRLVEESEIMKEDDVKWPKKNIVGRQELEIRLGNEHISFETAKIGSLVEVQDSDDPEGLRVFYYLVQDLKCLIFSLISLHFKIKPI